MSVYGQTEASIYTGKSSNDLSRVSDYRPSKSSCRKRGSACDRQRDTKMTAGQGARHVQQCHNVRGLRLATYESGEEITFVQVTFDSQGKTADAR